MTEASSRFSSYERASRIREIRFKARTKLAEKKRKWRGKKETAASLSRKEALPPGILALAGVPALLTAFLNDHIDMLYVSGGVVLEAGLIAGATDAFLNFPLERVWLYADRGALYRKAKEIRRNANVKIRRLNQRFDRAILPVTP